MYVDIKYTMWDRYYIDVDKLSKENVIELIDNNSESLLAEILTEKADGPDSVLDSYEIMSVDENNNQATVELWEDDDIIHTNVPKLNAKDFQAALRHNLDRIQELVNTMPQKGNKCEDCQRMCMQIGINELDSLINGIEDDDLKE